MNQIKRPLPVSVYPTCKKIRRNTCLEDLSNELFYDVFDYLDGCDMLKAFAHLNSRFDNLISNPCVMLKINLSSMPETRLERCCREIIIPNRHRLCSLQLSENSLIDEFFNYCSIDSSFTCLQSISIDDISEPNIFLTLSYLSSLPCLSSLTIKLELSYFYSLNSIYRLIFRLPHLKYCKLSTSDNDEYDAAVPISINKNYSTIERLIIKHVCTINEITSLLLYTPNLRYLFCEHLNNSDEDQMNTNNNQLNLPQLTHISIESCGIDFDELKTFLKSISHELRFLRLTVVENPTYLDADQWRKLIKNYMPKLTDFYFSIHMFNDKDYLFPADHDFLSLFRIEKNLAFQIDINYDLSILSIYPWKETWYSCPTDNPVFPHAHCSSKRTVRKHNIGSNLCILPIQLMVDSYTTTKMDEAFMDKMKSSSTITASTHLNIGYGEAQHDLFIKIISLLPNLNSLELSSMPPLEENLLSTKTSEMFLAVSNTNKITKVKLNVLNNIQQIYFLMDLCSQMQYLEVECKTENDVISIVTFIARNSIKHMRYFRYLRLSVPDANENLIENLKIIVAFEKAFYSNEFFTDYEIHRIQNKIFLNWTV